MLTLATQTLDVVSFNIWQVLISLCNLLIIFLIIKKLFFKPVTKMMNDREKLANSRLDEAAAAMATAEQTKQQYEKALENANERASEIIDSARMDANRRTQSMINDAREKANEMVKNAEKEIAVERAQADEQMKAEIADLSTQLASKILAREINKDDHEQLIDEFIKDLDTHE